MPLVNFIIIDSYGKSRIISIALLSNEQQISYEFIFEAFLKKMKRTPDVLFVDEDYRIINGKFFFFNNILINEKIFII